MCGHCGSEASDDNKLSPCLDCKMVSDRRHVAPHLARGMADNPDLAVFVANGYFDLATTFFAAEYNVRRSTVGSRISFALRANSCWIIRS